MSKTTVIHPIVACLEEAKSFLETSANWEACNENQESFLKHHYNDDIQKLDDILDTLATTDHKELMKFFSDRGFSFDIEPFDSGEFGAGSVMSVLVEWLEHHREHKLVVDDTEYEGVFVKSNYGVSFSPNHPHPVLSLITKTDDVVNMTIADKTYEGLDLAARINEIRSTAQADDSYEDAIFPMVDLDHEVDISWICNLKIAGKEDTWRVVKAEQKTRFKMNHIGAKAESAVAMRVFATAVRESKPVLLIDKPFFVWITRPGIKDPLFMGYITEDDWKNPGEIS